MQGFHCTGSGARCQQEIDGDVADKRGTKRLASRGIEEYSREGGGEKILWTIDVDRVHEGGIGNCV